MSAPSSWRLNQASFAVGMPVVCVDAVTGTVRWTGVVSKRSEANGALEVLPDGKARYNRNGKELRYKFSAYGMPLGNFAGCAMQLKPQIPEEQ